MSQTRADYMSDDLVWADPNQAPPRSNSAWVAFLILWAIFFLLGVGITARIPSLMLAALAVPVLLTVTGATWKPLFGLAVVMVIMPIGPAVRLGGVFSADRGIGIVFAVATVIHYIFSGQRIRIASPVVWSLLALTLLSLTSALWASDTAAVLVYSRLLAQLWLLAAVATIVVHDSDILWPLRVFVAAALVVVVIARIYGIETDDTSRFTVAIEEDVVMNPNLFACMLGPAFFASMYLFARDPHRWLRWLYAAAFLAIPLVMFMTASRKGLVAIVATLVLPFLSIKRIIRQPKAAVGVIAVLMLLAAMLVYGMQHWFSQATVTRVFDRAYAAESVGVRTTINQEAIDFALQNPLGAGTTNFWASTGHGVHNDFLWCLANLGFAGAALFLTFMGAMLWSIHTAPEGWDKWLARAIVLFLIVEGLGGAWLFKKHYWIFMVLAYALVRKAKLAARQPSADLAYAPAAAHQA